MSIDKRIGAGVPTPPPTRPRSKQKRKQMADEQQDPMLILMQRIDLCIQQLDQQIKELVEIMKAQRR